MCALLSGYGQEGEAPTDQTVPTATSLYQRLGCGLAFQLREAQSAFLNKGISFWPINCWPYGRIVPYPAIPGAMPQSRRPVPGYRTVITHPLVDDQNASKPKLCHCHIVRIVSDR
jgi:hypothetical protein